jgi:hypothetical protein
MAVTFKSFLSAVGHDFVTALNWVGGAKGQSAIAGTEAVVNSVVDAINPAAGLALDGVEALINAGLKQVVAIEASAAALNVQSGTGAQKLATVVAALAPQAQALLVAVGVSTPTAVEVQTLTTNIANGLVAILNALPAPPVTTAS